MGTCKPDTRLNDDLAVMFNRELGRSLPQDLPENPTKRRAIINAAAKQAWHQIRSDPTNLTKFMVSLEAPQSHARCVVASGEVVGTAKAAADPMKGLYSEDTYAFLTDQAKRRKFLTNASSLGPTARGRASIGFMFSVPMAALEQVIMVALLVETHPKNTPAERHQRIGHYFSGGAVSSPLIKNVCTERGWSVDNLSPKKWRGIASAEEEKLLEDFRHALVRVRQRQAAEALGQGKRSYTGLHRLGEAPGLPRGFNRFAPSRLIVM